MKKEKKSLVDSVQFVGKFSLHRQIHLDCQEVCLLKKSKE